MEENEEVIIETENDTETTENEVEDLDLDTEDVDVEALKKENATLQAQKEHWRKKAQEKSESPKEEDKTSTKSGELSTKDVLYLAKADIHEDDMEEVTTLAEKMGWDVKKAHEYLKPRLEVNSEKRKTSETSHTGSGRRGSMKVTDEALLNNANSGKLPESDEEINRLMRAKMSNKG